MVTPDVRDTRRWQLVGYRRPVGEEKGDQVIVNITCVGDAELNTRLRDLEARSDFRRAAVCAETLANRQPVIEPIILTRAPNLDEILADPVIACDVCEQPEPKCRALAAINGHDFVPGEPIWLPR